MSLQASTDIHADEWSEEPCSLTAEAEALVDEKPFVVLRIAVPNGHKVIFFLAHEPASLLQTASNLADAAAQLSEIAFALTHPRGCRDEARACPHFEPVQAPYLREFALGNLDGEGD